MLRRKCRTFETLVLYFPEERNLGNLLPKNQRGTALKYGERETKMPFILPFKMPFISFQQEKPFVSSHTHPFQDSEHIREPKATKQGCLVLAGIRPPIDLLLLKLEWMLLSGTQQPGFPQAFPGIGLAHEALGPEGYTYALDLD